jgi:hypothetical protein
VTFVVNVTSTDPIWFYCSLASHCQEGMVGVVNPPSGKSVADYMNAAASVTQASSPASLTGGTTTSINEATETITSNIGSPSQTATTTSGSTSVRSGVQASPTASTSTGPKSDARRISDMSIVLGLGVVAGGLAVLMG